MQRYKNFTHNNISFSFVHKNSKDLYGDFIFLYLCKVLRNLMDNS